VFEQAVREVVLRIPNTAARLSVSEPTVATATGHLESLGILEEVTGRPRNKLIAYVRYLSILSE
jgi:Fic family protein